MMMIQREPHEQRQTGSSVRGIVLTTFLSSRRLGQPKQSNVSGDSRGMHSNPEHWCGHPVRGAAEQTVSAARCQHHVELARGEWLDLHIRMPALRVVAYAT